MIINKIDFQKNYYFWIRNSFWDYVFEILSYNMSFDYMVSLISDKKELDWDYWVNKILDWIKNVKICFNDDVSNIPWYYTMLNCPREDLIDSEETRSWDYAMISFSWQSEVEFANSWKDITYIHNLEGTQGEYYSTPEVIEVLEKWKEALERWSNPVERQKMIEEYEREHN